MRRAALCSLVTLAVGCADSTNATSVEKPRCVMWRRGTITDKDYAVMDLDYGPRECEHVARLLNADEHMHGPNGTDFRCQCVERR